MDVPRDKPKRQHRRVFVGGSVASLAVMTTVGLGTLRSAPPAVGRSTLTIDTVRRGEMVRAVQGQGSLVPEQMQWVSAVCAARVEKLFVTPGTAVQADTVLVELANPDIELQALEAERQFTAAASELVGMQASQRNQRLEQESLIASLHAEQKEASLRAAADHELMSKGFLSALEMSQSQGKAEELASRVGFEDRRLAALADGMAAQLAAQRAQVEKLRAIAEFRRRELAALHVRAGVPGVLTELPPQVGQWVTPGALLAKVVRPEKLKAEIRVAETRVRDVQVGQPATIDTRNGAVLGHVARIDPAVQAGTVKVDLALDAPLPKGARPDQSVEGTIELERLTGVLYVGRPALGQSEGAVSMFKLDRDGRFAERVKVQLGKSSVRTVEVQAGLAEGDQVILSSLSQWDAVERIELR